MIGGRRKGYKGLSPRQVPEKFLVRLPKEAAEWLRKKANEEKKSYGLILAELINRQRSL